MSQFSLDPDLVEEISNRGDPEHIYTLFCEKYQSNIVSPPLDTYKTLILCTAIDRGHDNLVRFLLSGPLLNFDVNYKYGYASPLPLLCAVRTGNKAVTQLLVEGHNAHVDLQGNVDVPGHRGNVCRAIDLSLSTDDVETFLLLAPHFDPSRWMHSRSLLHFSCQHGAFRCTEAILDGGCPSVNATDVDNLHAPEQDTPLMHAVCHSSRLVRLLLRHGADVNRKSSRTGNTVLLCAASPSSYPSSVCGFFPEDLVEILDLLIEAGADVNVRNYSEESVVRLLLGHLHVGVCTRMDLVPPYDQEHHSELLLQALKTLLLKGTKLYPAARCPLQQCYIEQLSLVLDPCSRYNRGNACLIPTVAVAMRGLRRAVELLLEHDADFLKVTGYPTRATLLDSFLELLNNRCQALSIVRHLDHQSYKCIVGELKQLFLIAVSHGGKVTSMSGFVKLMGSNKSLCQPFFELFLDTLNQPSYNEALHQILQQIGRMDPEGMLGGKSAFWPYLHTCRSLQVLCRAAIVQCLLPKLTQAQHLHLPAALKAYLTFTHPH